MSHTANGHEFHFDTIDLSTRKNSAQIVSAAIHATAILAALFLFASIHDVTHPNNRVLFPIADSHLTFQLPSIASEATPSIGTPDAGGGNHDPRPASAGELAHYSRIPLAAPNIVHQADVNLPVPPAVFDAHAPEQAANVAKLGLPWMTVESDSAGPGGPKGIGNGHGHGMGEGDGEGIQGNGPNGNGNGITPPVCNYCPEPPYTDQARKAKIQGHMTVEVLVGVDGHAQQVRIAKGLEESLDEQTVQAIKSWRFGPALTRNRQPVPMWVTIETDFRLY